MRAAETDGRRGLRTCGEAAAAAQQDLHSRYRVYIVVVDADALICEVHVVELGSRVMNEPMSAGIC